MARFTRSCNFSTPVQSPEDSNAPVQVTTRYYPHPDRQQSRKWTAQNIIREATVANARVVATREHVP